MWKKTKKNKIPNPPSHPPCFRALLPLAGAIVEELGPVFTDPVLLEELSPSVVEGSVGSGSELVDVGPVGVVVKELTRSVIEVVALVVVGIVVEELVGVVLEVAALVVVGIVAEELARVVLEMRSLEIVRIVMKGVKLVSRVGITKVFETDIVVSSIFTQG